MDAMRKSLHNFQNATWRDGVTGRSLLTADLGFSSHWLHLVSASCPTRPDLA